jgi:hypothetical protein
MAFLRFLWLAARPLGFLPRFWDFVQPVVLLFGSAGASKAVTSLAPTYGIDVLPRSLITWLAIALLLAVVAGWRLQRRVDHLETPYLKLSLGGRRQSFQDRRSPESHLVLYVKNIRGGRVESARAFLRSFALISGEYIGDSKKRELVPYDGDDAARSFNTDAEWLLAKRVDDDDDPYMYFTTRSDEDGSIGLFPNSWWQIQVEVDTANVGSCTKTFKVRFALRGAGRYQIPEWEYERTKSDSSEIQT